jgi:hypothetical protein
MRTPTISRVAETNPMFVPSTVDVVEEDAMLDLFLPNRPRQTCTLIMLGRFHDPLSPLPEQENHRNSRIQTV